jgi:uronate dehydrogenase
MMKVLVTGAAGVVGTAIAPLLARDHELVLLDRRPAEVSASGAVVRADVTDWRQVRDALAPHGRIDAVIQLATTTPTAGEVAAEELAATELPLSVLGTWTVLNEAHRLGATRFLLASSLNAYGDLTAAGPFTEDLDLLSLATVEPCEPYGLAKVLAERMTAYFCATRGCTGVSFRLDAVHVPNVMHRRGIHADDIAEAFRLGLTSALTDFQVYNLVADPTRHRAPNARITADLRWQPAHVFTHRPDLEDWTFPLRGGASPAS